MPELFGIEDGLRDRVFGTCLDLPFKTFDLFIEIDRTGIHTDADREFRRLADRVVAEVEVVVELVDHIREADRIDVKDGGRVRIRPHFWRIAGYQEQVVQPKRRG